MTCCLRCNIYLMLVMTSCCLRCNICLMLVLTSCCLKVYLSDACIDLMLFKEIVYQVTVCLSAHQIPFTQMSLLYMERSWSPWEKSLFLQNTPLFRKLHFDRIASFKMYQFRVWLKRWIFAVELLNADQTKCLALSIENIEPGSGTGRPGVTVLRFSKISRHVRGRDTSARQHSKSKHWDHCRIQTPLRYDWNIVERDNKPE